jgi:hypothetical protein
MLRNAAFTAWFATVYLVTYSILLHIDAMQNVAAYMFLFSPVVILWAVFTIIKFGKYSGAGLNGDEFGYDDVNKNELGTF